MKIFLFILLISFSLSSCKEEAGAGGFPLGEMKIQYPYRASNERLAAIRRGSKEIVAGMSKNDVLEKIGEPDEINETLSKNDLKTKIGFSFVYLEQRDKEEGSVKEKNERLVRVHFGLNDRVIRIDFIK